FNLCLAFPLTPPFLLCFSLSLCLSLSPLSLSFSSDLQAQSVIFYEGEWTGLCFSWLWDMMGETWLWDMRQVKVVCRELNCGNPVSESRGPLIEDGRGGVRLYSRCSGDDEKIVRLLSLCFLFSEPEDVRLVGGGSRCAGGVEWYDQGEWRTVGSEDEDQRDVAAVVCRQLGCGSTVSVPPGNTTRGFGVYCDGYESALRELFYGTTNTCQPQSITAVRITESLSSSVLTTVFSSLLFTAEYSVRLVNGTTSCSGTVEVFYEGEWTGLCTGWWRMMRENNVVCRQLDCGDVVSVSVSRGPLIEDGRRGVRLLRCSGDESSIRQCDIIGRPGFCDESVRLVDGAGFCSGRVEVKSYQSWASVCEADFDRQDAEVVCGELGCGAPAALQGGLYGEGDGQTWDKEFQCKGKESLLLDCDTSDRENNTCLPGNAVGLTCSGKKQFVTQSTLFLTWSEEYERQYRCVLVRR
uniref:SRCR domain-containing protein n=1 Tax=Oncorhynchus kisutch TaxID=8019 RepID=A0A8C7N0C6_ONCKI